MWLEVDLSKIGYDDIGKYEYEIQMYDTKYKTSGNYLKSLYTFELEIWY